MIYSTLKKLISLLDKKQKFKVVIVVILLIISGILETVGISLIFPLLSAMLDKEMFAKNEYVVLFSDFTGITDINSIIYIIIGILCGIYIFKNIYSIFCIYIQSRFVNRNRAVVMRNLLLQYLNKPYEYYFHADSAVILRTIYGDMDNVFNLLMLCFSFMAELIICASLCVVLLFIDYKMCIFMVALFFITTVFITKVMKPNLNDTGENLRIELGNVYKGILQPVVGIKDVKVSNKESYFTKVFENSAKAYAKYQIKNNVYSLIPRQLIETIAIVGILIYVLVSLMIGTETSVLIGLVAAFGVAAMRLLPSVNRLNTHMANISLFQSALNNIYDNINMDDVRKQEKYLNSPTEEKIEKKLIIKSEIKLENITYKYPETDKYIFDNANMIIPIGKSIGVVGQSGSGKSTIVDVLLGLLKIENGNILCDKKNVMENYSSWLFNIGYIPQTIYMLDDSIRNNIAFGVLPENIDDNRIWEVLEEAQLKEFVQKLPNGLDEAIGERGVRISGGQRQRLGIARALYHNPQILVFDEATSALDNETEAAVMEAIESLHGQKTMVIIAHRLKTIENCDIIYEVKDGRILRKEGKLP